MKAFRILTTVVSIGFILVLFGCGKNTPAESTQDKQLKLLSKTWKASTVTLGGVDQSTTWTNFQLTISGTKTPPFNYSCASRPTTNGPWPASGTWTFDDTTPATVVIRAEDNLKITYAVTATTLQMTFHFTGNGYPGPRVSNIAGDWAFNFTSN